MTQADEKELNNTSIAQAAVKIKEVATPVDEKIDSPEKVGEFFENKAEKISTKPKSKSEQRREAIQKEEGPQITEDDILLDLLKQFQAPVPEQYITSYEDKGNIFKGYQSQYAINLLNKVVGLNGWMFQTTIRKEEAGQKGWAVAMEGDLIIHYKNITFVRVGSGGSYAVDIANAYKGARTSCFKNACRYLGIGQELYTETKDDDIMYEPIQKEEQATALTGEAVELEKKIAEAKTIEELKALEDAIRSNREEGVMKILLKKFNNKKLEFLTAK